MRQPFALANWKMAMTVAQSRRFVAGFLARTSDLLGRVEVLLCPPCTALHAVAEAVRGTPAGVGGQNVSAEADEAHTGQVSARLLASVGCRWVLLGHWEVRRQLGDDDALVNRKVHRALEAGLRPLLSVGEARGQEGGAEAALGRQLPVLLHGTNTSQIAGMVFLYEPEWTIGVARPAPRAHVEAGCRAIRAWLRVQYGEEAAESARAIYGGSVSPAYAADLLQAPDVDGLGAARQGRNPEAWATLVRLIADARMPDPCSPPN